MKRKVVSLGIAALVVSIVMTTFIRQTPTPAQQPAPPRPDAAAKCQLIGATSCSASVCHGGADLGQLRSEATTWRALDPHARAYESLLSDRSKTMAKHLWGDITQAHEAPLCLKCHVHPEYENARPNFRRQDGVGCESCHGAAQDWLTPHYRGNADRKTLGMADTKSLVGRANLCVRCHVGTPDANVDHDLIAAGHPALRFEFSSYFANLPPHWRQDKLPEAKIANGLNGIHAWAIGQDVSAAAAAELLAHRTKIDQPWPEFAELDCFSCHHDLHSKSWLQSKEYLQVRRPGKLQLSNWYSAMTFITNPNHERPTRVSVAGPLLDPIRDREKINRKATKDAAEFREVAARRDVDPGQILRLRDIAQSIENAEGDLPFSDFTAQLFLALLAAETKQHHELVGRLEKELRFPPGYNSPHRPDAAFQLKKN